MMPGVDAGEKVLLVDDNATNLQVLYRTLDGCGYTLLIAKDGAAALNIARKAIPSLILLDIMMPGMSGFEVCEQLKQDESTKDIPVIFLSAMDDSQSKVRGLALGGVDYIAKPFQSDEVVARVRTHIKMHRLEAALAQKNADLEDENQRILDAVAEGIVSLDSRGRIRSVNPMACEIMGWSSSDVTGESIHQLQLFKAERDNCPEEFGTLYPAYSEGKVVSSDQAEIRRKSGDMCSISFTCSPRKDGGAVLAMRDITEWLANREALLKARQELETQRQNLAHIERLSTGGEMAAGIAHEVNQPLTAVSNYARLMQRMIESGQTDQAKMVEVLDKINIQAERASAVIQRFRNYLRKPTEGRRELPLNTLLEKVLALAEVDSRVNEVPLRFEAGEDVGSISVDEVQFQQVVLNLLRNAMEAMRETNHRSEGVLLRSEAKDGGAYFEVVDRGPGIKIDMREELFTPFMSSKTDGMGVGLSICQSIMQGHGGDIGHRPNPKGGAIFWGQLPTV